MMATRRDGSRTSGYTALHAAVAFTFGWLGVCHFTSLPLVGSRLKELLFIPFVVLSIAAVSARGKKSRPTILVYGFVAVAFFSLLYSTEADFPIADIQLRVLYLMSAIAALLVLRALNNTYEVKRLLKAVMAGLLLPTIMVLFATIADPATLAKGRLWPFGVNPNQVGPMFSITAPLALYLFLDNDGDASRFAWGVYFLTAVTLGLLTGSRATAATILLPVIVLIGDQLRTRQRTRLAVVLILLTSFTVGLVVHLWPDSSGVIERLGNSETSRDEIALTYLAGIYTVSPDRVLFGQLASSGMPMDLGEIDVDPHNAYLVWFYTGGLLVLSALVGLVLGSMRHIWRGVRRLRYLPEPTLFLAMSSMLAAVWIRSMSGIVAYYPTHAFSMWHLLLVGTVALVSSPARTPRAPLAVSHRSESAEARSLNASLSS